GSAIITADHGNAEQMFDPEAGGAFTAHTLSPVPCIVVSDGAGALRADGILADVAPTVCDLLGIVQPAEWTGRTLIA
ncbi:MAG: 2,3-bisphosphoglycerate-independent phosphoglycerate mutase, partial [Actinomycetota bacterium]|nr:2,3-bisphosphoglycerate-independent phosphoglycerate mutase [Actinomycetota bacterium]